MFTKTRKMLASTLTVLALTATVHAAEETPFIESHTTVNFDDLNLQREADVQTLYGRLKRASRNVCADVWGREVSNSVRRRQCENEAIAKALQDVKQRGVRVAALVPRK